MSDSENPYAAPSSAVVEDVGPTGGSIEATLEGQSTLDVGDVLKEAWDRVSGIKLLVFASIVLTIVAALVVGVPLAFLFGPAAASGGFVTTFGLELVSNVLTTLVTAPILAGALYLGMRHVNGLAVQFDHLLSQFSIIVPIVLVSILQSIAVTIGYLLLIIPGVYLTIAFCLALPLVVEKGYAPVDALKMSLQLVNKQFLNVFLIGLVVFLAVGLSFITIVGPIWTVPWGLMALVITYRQLAGIALSD